MSSFCRSPSLGGTCDIASEASCSGVPDKTAEDEPPFFRVGPWVLLPVLSCSGSRPSHGLLKEQSKRRARMHARGQAVEAQRAISPPTMARARRWFCAGVACVVLKLLVSHIAEVAAQLMTEVEVQPEKRTSDLLEECKASSSNYGSPSSPCKIALQLGGHAEIQCSSTTPYLWPGEKGKEWTSSEGVACLDPPSVKSDGSVEECTNPTSWKDVGVVMTYPSSPSTPTAAKMKLEKDPLKFGSVMTLYGVCMHSNKSYPLFWEVRLIPEPLPVYKPNVFDFEYDSIGKGRFKYIVDLYRGESIRLKCDAGGKIVPPDALDKDGDFCRVPVSSAEACDNPVPWSDANAKSLSLYGNSYASVWLSHTSVDGGVVDAYFSCTSVINEVLFNLVLHPTISDRFVPFYQSVENRYEQCHPADGPDPGTPCEKEVRQLDGFAYVNCTGVGRFDPPDINSPTGSFCAEQYVDYDTPCKATKKWADIFTTPQVQGEAQLFSVFNSSRDNLKQTATVYGRCGDSARKALFFAFTFKKEMKTDRFRGEESSEVRVTPAIGIVTALFFTAGWAGV